MTGMFRVWPLRWLNIELATHRFGFKLFAWPRVRRFQWRQAGPYVFIDFYGLHLHLWRFPKEVGNVER